MQSQTIKFNNIQAQRPVNRTTYGEFAASFNEAGYKVIPVLNKRPIVKWKDLIEAPQTLESIELMTYEASRMGYGQEIGIAIMGTDEICSIDIDSNDPRWHDIVPISPIKIVGGKGFKCLYRHKGLRSQRDAVYPVEILAKNTIFVVPPSIHHLKDDGSAHYYKLVGEHRQGIEHFPIKELPEISQSDVDRLFEFARTYSIRREKVTIGGGPDDTARITEGTIGRNVMLFNQCCNEIEKRGLAGDEINEEFFNSLASWAVEQDKKLFPGNSYFTLDDDNRRYKFIAKVAARGMVDRAWELIKDRVIVGNGAELVVDKLRTYSSEVYATTEIEEVFEKQLSSTLSDLTKIIPTAKEWENVIPTSGIISEIVERYNYNSPNPLPQFALATALTIQSAAASNMVKSCIRTRDIQTLTSPNLYCCVIGPTGIGKNSVKSTINEFLSYSHQLRTSFLSGMASPQGVMMRAMKSPRRTAILNIDEITKIFDGTMADRNHDFLLEAFTSTGDTLGGVEAATKEYKQAAIRNVGIVLCGMTTPDGMKKFINNDAMRSGLAGRFLYFIGQKEPGMKSIADRFHIDDNDTRWRADWNDPSQKLLLEEHIDGFMDRLLNEDMTMDRDWQPIGPVTPDSELLRPVKPMVIHPQSAGAINSFGRLLGRLTRPIEMIHNFCGVTKNDDGSIGSVDGPMKNLAFAVDNMLMRAPELINKLALNLCISDGAFMRDGGDVHAITEAHFQVAAKIYELHCRGIIGLIGQDLMVESSSAGIDAGMSYLSKRLDMTTGLIKCTVHTARKQFVRMYGKRSHEILNTCLKNLHGLYGTPFKFVNK